MFFNLKSAFLVGLAATAYASPILPVDPLAPQNIEARSIEARAQAKDVDCGGRRFTAQDIKSTITASKTAQDKQYKDSSYKFPKPYGNGEKFFNSPSQLYEYPLMSPTFTGKGKYEIYRVIMNENYNYMGSLYHTSDVSNSFHKCVSVEDQEKEAKKNEKEEQKDDKKAGKGKGGKKGH